MPLTIEYRPFTLPPAPIPAGRRGLAVAGALVQPDSRPRDLTARIRRRDLASARRALAAPESWRRRLGGIAAAGAIAIVLGPLGWVAPGGIGHAHAEAGESRLEPAESPGESLPGSSLHSIVPRDGGPIAPETASNPDGSQRGDEEPARLISPVGPAARPLLAAGSATDRTRALQCLTAAVYYEAAGEPVAGQRAVAQVVLNRVAHPAFPDSVCGVVYQGSERPTCQFSFACDGAMERQPVRAAWDRARRVAAKALAGHVYAPVGLATFYHTDAVHPAWDGRMKLVATIGAHEFYRWPGAAGRPTAFHVAYKGDEPLAAPRSRSADPDPLDGADPATIERAWEQDRAEALAGAEAVAAKAAPAEAPAPTYVLAAQSRGGDSPYNTLPGPGSVLPEYQHSGTWIVQPGAK